MAEHFNAAEEMIRSLLAMEDGRKAAQSAKPAMVGSVSLCRRQPLGEYA